MTNNVAYEIQRYSGGKWKTDSIYDDCELAVLEARNIAAGRRVPLGLRVVKETYNESTGLITSATVHRVITPEKDNVQEPRDTAPPRKTAAPARPAASNELKRRRRGPPKKRETDLSGLKIGLTLGGIVLLGGMMLFGIRLLSQYL
jgi:hypothetical protein